MKDPFGEGAERIVYEMTEIDVNKQPVGDRFVAKDSKFVLEKQTMGRGFHQSFVKTQRKAAKVAKKFNAAQIEQLNTSTLGISWLIPCLSRAALNFFATFAALRCVLTND